MADRLLSACSKRNVAEVAVAQRGVVAELALVLETIKCRIDLGAVFRADVLQSAIVNGVVVQRRAAVSVALADAEEPRIGGLITGQREGHAGRPTSAPGTESRAIPVSEGRPLLRVSSRAREQTTCRARFREA